MNASEKNHPLEKDKKSNTNDFTILQQKVATTYHRGLLSLINEATNTHIQHHKLGEVQKSTLLSIKTGGCAENCGYCSQSSHFKTEIEKTPTMSREKILHAAAEAKATGATRFCMGSAGTRIKPSETYTTVLSVLPEIKAMGLETCLTMGMLNTDQANELQQNGLDFYNHNIDTSRNHYDKIVSTRKFDERLQTLQIVRESGMKVCTGGILGMNETSTDRISFITELAHLNPSPESLTVNRLVPIKGTPLENAKTIDEMEIVRTIACLRIFCPKSYIRLSAGRETMPVSTQALCFLAGANSIFSGDKLLTTPNKKTKDDEAMFANLGLKASKQHY